MQCVLFNLATNTNKIVKMLPLSKKHTNRINMPQ